jgi:serralysin
MRPVCYLFLVLLTACGTPKKHRLGQGICTERYTGHLFPPFQDHYLKAADHREFKWPVNPGEVLVLRVKFLNGGDFQHTMVKFYAKEWEDASALIPGTKKHKIQFVFLGDQAPETEIRIAFGTHGSESLVGSDCRNVGQKESTTLFGWVDQDHGEDDMRAVILHELGHTLGLIHEHQSPKSEILWDSSAVYEFYRTTQNPPWDSAKVNQNIFDRYTEDESNSTEFDERSIMYYEFPEGLARGMVTRWNTVLSALDKSFIKQMYPG